MTLENDIDTLARTIWGEARSDGLEGMEAVAHVVLNRKAVSDQQNGYWWGKSIQDICRYPFQFSVWNIGDINRKKILRVTPEDRIFGAAIEIAEDACSGVLGEDITKGATHYYNPAGTNDNPVWAEGEPLLVCIGKHQFYRPREVPRIKSVVPKPEIKPKKSFWVWLFGWF